MPVDDLARRVAEVVSDIPPGQVMTYGDVAAVVGTGPRQVGRLMAVGDLGVAWWRVTNAAGLLPDDLRPRAHAAYRVEGTPVRGDRVDLKRARWWPGVD